ncbi:MAG: flavodoxin family protein [Bacillota bacterium]|nr:flavodoxin family protein [Bacillota bacterium]
MNAAVRYYSRSGNTKALAEAIANAANTMAISVDQKDAAITEPVDVLFIGGALYAYGLDKHLKDYLKTLKQGDAKKAVVFSTSWVSKHAIDLIKQGLSEAGIPAEEKYFYVKKTPDAKQLEEAMKFAKQYL